MDGDVMMIRGEGHGTYLKCTDDIITDPTLRSVVARRFGGIGDGIRYLGSWNDWILFFIFRF